MDGCFTGVPTDNIEKWMSNLIIFDTSAPHTKTRLSPITFTDFLGRSNIMCLNQHQVYEAANKFWRRYLSFSPNLLESIHENDDLSICEVEHTGWNKLVDYFNRILEVQKFSNTYYQMHYLAHCFYLFSTEDLGFGDNKNCYKIIFNEIVSPILYETCIPVTNCFWPSILNYTDMRFRERLVLLCARISSFIESHAGRTMNTKQFDERNLKALYKFIKDGMAAIHENKYNDELWKVPLVNCLVQSDLIRADMEACELHDMFERDGMKCCSALRQLKNIRERYDKNALNDDPDFAIDCLLDVYMTLKKGLESYNIPKEEVRK